MNMYEKIMVFFIFLAVVSYGFNHGSMFIGSSVASGLFAIAGALKSRNKKS